MPERLCFHLDEHISHKIAVALRMQGIDVTTTFGEGMLGNPDDAHLRFAQSQGRVIVTDDCEFLAAAAISDDHSGVVFCRRTYYTLGDIIRFLILLHAVYTREEMRGRVEFPFMTDIVP